jgi:hypothetical protein
LLTFSGKSRRLRLLTAAEIAVCLKELNTGERVRQERVWCRKCDFCLRFIGTNETAF